MSPLSSYIDETLSEPLAQDCAEESMVPDARSVLSPSEMVDSKLESMLQESAVMVSHLQRAVSRRVLQG